jgi:hypothetical protein
MAADPRDLCTLAQVRLHEQISNAEDEAQDELIQELITSSSVSLMEYAQCNFVEVDGDEEDGAGVARDFRYDGRGVMMFGRHALRTLASMQIDVDGASPDPTTLTASDYRLQPVSKRDGVWRGVHLRGFPVAPESGARDWPSYRVVRVTGDWGFAAIPTPVERACILTTLFMLRGTSQFAGAEFGGDAMPGNDRVAIPGSARRLLDPWRRRAI